MVCLGVRRGASMARAVVRDDQLELPLALDSPLTGKIKGDRHSMVHAFFPIEKKPRKTIMMYDDGATRISVDGMRHGLATVYDKDILIYCASLLVERKNRNEGPNPTLTFTAHDICRVLGIEPCNTSY